MGVYKLEFQSPLNVNEYIANKRNESIIYQVENLN